MKLISSGVLAGRRCLDGIEVSKLIEQSITEG